MMLDWQTMLLVYVALLGAMLMLGCPIAIALGLTAFAGIVLRHGWDLMPTIGDIVWNTSNSFTLVAIPMFILMGEVIMQTGVARRFYRGLASLLIRVPGGLAHANIVGCAMFSAICGSSVATALTMSQVAMPELKRRGYDPGLIAGSLAAGGTLGILIPPSIPMIIYAVTVQASIVDLFMAGVVPGLILAALFMVWIAIAVRRNPALVPQTEIDPAMVRSVGQALWDCTPLVALIGVAIGSLYLGLVTPTEAGAFGALCALVIGAGFRELTFEKLRAALSASVGTSAVVFYIIVTGSLLSFGIVDSGIARGVSAAVVAADLSPLQFFLIISVVYIILGMLIEGVSMMLLTVPVLYPSMIALGFDPVWFGVVLVVFIELGALTPPMGLNLFAIHSVAKDIPLKTIIRGSFPYVIVMLLFLALLYAFPGIALWLPGTLK
ncbi:MAG: TRAP transporter large permease subunit [Comamonadaceae bacterium]|nr:MAG: TRAP transporter large permease subunit [Comamonadaceae bacterium]